MLSAAIFIPIFAAVALALLPRRGDLTTGSERRLQAIATVIAALPLGLIVIAWLGFKGLQR